jgi:transcription initiation factor TFIIIB Brf1 subunit/transcription initiation factor TFIIB
MEEKKCLHLDSFQEGTNHVCLDCGEVLPLKNEESIAKHHTYTTLSYVYRKPAKRSIHKDIAHLPIPKMVVDTANELYLNVYATKACQNKQRQTLIFACIFHAFKMHHIPKSLDMLKSIFNSTYTTKSKSIHSGLKLVTITLKMIGTHQRGDRVTPYHLIGEILKKIQVSEDKAKKIQESYHLLEGKSELINRSRPQSVAAGVVWLFMKHTGLSIQEYTKIVGLSETTIYKMTKDMEEVLRKSTSEKI